MSNHTRSIFLPFVYKFDSENTPQVKATISGVDIELPMDTGSTGILIGAPLLPMVGPEDGTPSYEFLSSSRILYNGRLVELPITFHGPKGTNATATVPVLVVDESVVCPWYDAKVDGPCCPFNPNGPAPIPRDTSRITYMGVGFGRNQHGDGQPHAIPRTNPFLNVESINGELLLPGVLRTGYTISTEGVYLGLTPENTRGFVFTNLEPGLTHEEDARDWAMVKMCFSVNGEVYNRGSALIDTGVAQMYLRADEGMIPNITIRNPNLNGSAKWVHRAKPGTKLTIGIPSLDVAVAEYSFTVGEASEMAPTHVIPSKQKHPAYVNTGRHFFFGFSVAFDAVAGRLGFRPVVSPSL
ncbi:hypothetical protein K491DRAFT_675961 [Lophiostoma macrostomum CBS 122681]|uniref:Peptidase A1 domain-containing protein n=1 Tax=Lophiostoma macrostomum CBS 122681 TaxID=1314788 RepID=A0A6A6TIK4_9PLEO|nr:hypothetical protein K491DRAFT_675961 [Lophiostoma macrostomum CBS 122681]